jgi:hypothetical protein
MSFIPKSGDGGSRTAFGKTFAKLPVVKKSRFKIRGIVRDADGKRAGTIQATPEWALKIAEEEADNHIVYRLVDPPFNTYKTPDIFVRVFGKTTGTPSIGTPPILPELPYLFLPSREYGQLPCRFAV